MAEKLGSLEVELLAEILEYVDDESPLTTKSVLLVNKHFYATARKVSFRRKTLNFTFEPTRNHSHFEDSCTDPEDQLSSHCNAHEIIAKWLQNSEALRSIRHLRLKGCWTPSYHTYNTTQTTKRTLSVWTPLARLLENLANLRTLTWDCRGHIPLVLLDTLHKHQSNARLTVNFHERTSNTLDHNDPAEIALATSPALVAFRARLINVPEGHPDLREAAVERIIASAPNLKRATILKGHYGCVYHMISPEQETELSELSEKFFTHKVPNSSVRAFTLDGYGLSMHTVDKWGRHIDFSKLESLKCTQGFVPDNAYFSFAGKLLKNLRHVSLNFGYQQPPEVAAAADEYILNCAPLETLSLWSWAGLVTLPSILKHGPTLKSLQLHERESVEVCTARRLLSRQEIIEIRQSCPILHELTFDMDREAPEWEGEVENLQIYTELALFGSQLEKIQIYTNLGIAAQAARGNPPSYDGEEEDHTDEPARKKSKIVQRRNLLPMPNKAAITAQASHIWRTVFGARRQGARSLDYKIGEWERKAPGGYPASWMTWESTNRRFIKVRPNERDDRLDEPVVTAFGGYGDSALLRIAAAHQRRFE